MIHIQMLKGPSGLFCAPAMVGGGPYVLGIKKKKYAVMVPDPLEVPGLQQRENGRTRYVIILDEDRLGNPHLYFKVLLSEGITRDEEYNWCDVSTEEQDALTRWAENEHILNHLTMHKKSWNL